MSRTSGRTLIRRLAATLTLGSLAIGIALAASPGTAVAAAQAADAHAGGGTLVNATDAQVERALDIGNIPAAIVFIIDISGSMGAGPHPWDHNLYHYVYQDVPSYLANLADRDPQDKVAIVLLGKRTDTQILYPLGPPQGETGLPLAPYSDESDFGYAFKLAADVLTQASPTIKVGQVLLFSDGDVTEPASDDSEYASPDNNFTGSGWQELKSRVNELAVQQGMTISAYDVPLASSSSSASAYTSDQANALRQVFPDVMTLPWGSQLAQTLAGVNSRILDSKVASAAAPDSGAGVQVSWRGLPSTAAGPLDFRRADSLSATVTLTARTSKIPLYLSGLSATLVGLPGAPSVSLPDQSLRPGKPVTVPVHLSWPAGESGGSTMMGGNSEVPGSLELHGTVLSPFTDAITEDFKDSGYTPGSLQGSTNVPVSADVTDSALWPTILLIVLILAAVLTVALLARALLVSAGGTLILSPVSGPSNEVRVSSARKPVQTQDLIGLPGALTARGMLGGKVRVDLRLTGKPSSAETFRPDDRKMVAGVWIEYYGPDEDTRGRPPLRPRFRSKSKAG